MSEHISKESTEVKVVRTVCNICGTGCGLNVHVQGGKIVNVEAMDEHPFRRAAKSCRRFQSIIDWVYSKDRITSPMRRMNGQWTEISWDEALEFISVKLKDIKESYGAKSLVVNSGYCTLPPVAELCSRFCDAYGSPNYTSARSFCFGARTLGHSLTLDHDGATIGPNFRGTQCVVVWGANLPYSGVLPAAAASRAKEQGAKLIVIDPRVIPLAKRADIYAQIRPGTDCALVLGLLNVIISEKLYDKTFVEQWTEGFDKLAEHVKQYPPEKVEQTTWVPAETIRGIARMYATSKPACIWQGISLDHCTNGVQTSRAIAVMVTICGNFDTPGGSTYNRALSRVPLRIEGKISLEEAIGAEYPLFTRIQGQSTATPVPEAILTGRPYPVKALIIQSCNAMLTWPNANKLRKALEQLELLVVIDIFMTETAKQAHIVLPGASFLEATALKDYGMTSIPLIVLANKAIEPIGNSWPDFKIWIELALRMGYEEYFPWKTGDELHSASLEPTGIDIEQLRQNPMGNFYRPRGEREYLKEGFNTPSGKVEIYSKIMEQYGYDPLPTFQEPKEGLLSRPELAKEYPLTLITGARSNMYAHSQLHNIPRLRKLEPEPIVEIHASTAKGLGIADGDSVAVKSLRGDIQLKAKVTEDIHPQVVSIPHGWDEANANVLTDDMERDPISGYPGFKSVLCRVAKR